MTPAALDPPPAAQVARYLEAHPPRPYADRFSVAQWIVLVAAVRAADRHVAAQGYDNFGTTQTLDLDLRSHQPE